MKPTKNYVLHASDLPEIRYVGKTTQELKKRLQDHISEARRGAPHHRGCWIRAVLSRGAMPIIVWLDERECEQEGYALEAAYIEFFRAEGHDLTNNTRGGDGVGTGPDNVRFGKPCSAAHKEKIGDANRGRKHSPEFREACRIRNTGKTLSPAHREKISVALSGSNHYLYGVTGADHPNYAILRSPETRAKLQTAGRRSGPQKNNVSGYVGVSRFGKRWKAELGDQYLGIFATAEEAARVRDAEARKLWGSDCYLNFP